MLKIENVEIHGWEPAIRGMRNPKNSWVKSDSGLGCHSEQEGTFFCHECTSGCWNPSHVLGENDLHLAETLASAGTDHRKFLRMIAVYLDVIAPLYWWKEYDTYKVGTVANSCSTMHKIAEKEFTLEDFSCEHLGVYIPAEKNDGEECFQNLWPVLMQNIIAALNNARNYYLRENDPELKKAYWWQMIQLLPSSYNQRRTLMLNYEVLANIYNARRNHKLDEWHTFCDWIEALPYAQLITGKETAASSHQALPDLSLGAGLLKEAEK